MREFAFALLFSFLFTAQGYGSTPAADIQTIGRRVIVHIKRAAVKK